MADDRVEKLLRRSYQEIQQLRAALKEARAASAAPIAIVGMACRTPGGVEDPQGYWDLLDRGRDAIAPLPARFRCHEVFDADPDAPGKSYVREGGFLEHADRFDASFFGISPREAVQMDPQQRVMLEATWEALERAGIVPEGLHESRTGVFVGAMNTDYGLEDFSLEGLDGYRTTGTIGSVIAGRISYALGLQGPSMAVDTACSSSLVALHLACASLRQGECDLALGGGVTVMSTPSLFVEFSRLRASAPDGRCKAFSADADGAGWSEGCGVVVLKRLADAQRDGDRVLAVIRGSAVNQDGRSQGLTVPNGPSQARLVRQALQWSELGPEDVDAIEAHGTGTSLGDPIEAGALAEVFGPTRAADDPVWLGSSKSNIGHAQAAAGILGVIKMVLALQHERLPATLHAEHPTGEVEWSGSGLALLQRARDWVRQPEHTRRAGVSSFGIGGTNAHLILEEAPAGDSPASASESTSAATLPLLLSSQHEAGLGRQAGRWADWLERRPDVPWTSVLQTAAVRRSHLERRACLTAGDRLQAIEALRALADGRPHAAVTSAPAKPRGKRIFVFPGHGSQWAGMARVLLDESPAFREAMQACDEALRPHVAMSVAEVLRDPVGQSLERVDVLQPALFAMGVSLAAAWSELGVKPTAVMGHSVGELAAAVVCGALSIEEGARIVALRGRLIAGVSRRGGMLHVQCPEREMAAKLADWGGRLGVAVLNDRESSVVSGDIEAIAELEERLAADGVFCRRVQIGFAAHSPHMDEVLPPFARALGDVAVSEPRLPFFSTVTARKLGARDLGAAYWCRNVRDVVRFADTLEVARESGHDVFVELGGHPVLGVSMQAAGGDAPPVVVGSLSRGQGGRRALLASMGALHCHGVDVDWAIVAGEHPPLADLPTYTFEPTRYWLPAKGARGAASATGTEALGHPWLIASTTLAHDGTVVLSGRIDVAADEWLREHAVLGAVLLPGTAFLELALCAARSVGSAGVVDLDLEQPLRLPEAGALALQLHVAPPTAGGLRAFEVHARVEGGDAGWSRHASGHLGEASPARRGAQPWPAVDAASEVDPVRFYAELTDDGYDYGPAFQGLRAAWKRGGDVLARVSFPAGVSERDAEFGAHPARLDAALHGLLALALERSDGDLWLPSRWSDVVLGRAGEGELRVVCAPLERSDPDSRSFAVHVENESSQGVLDGTLLLRRASRARLSASLGEAARDLYRVQWRAVEPVPEAAEASTRAWWLGPDDGSATPLADRTVRDLDALRAALDAGESFPDALWIDVRPGADLDVGQAAHALTEWSLDTLQALLSEPRLGRTRLLWLARAPEPSQRLALAPLRGLLRSARNEHPDRSIRLFEWTPPAPPSAELRRWVEGSEEPELRVDGAGAQACRLTRVDEPGTQATPFDPARTVLITGGLGELGRSLAAHLVASHGVRHLLLTSRRGSEAEGVADVVASLRGAGAQTVEVVACDVADRGSLAEALAAIPAERRLGAVFHLAGRLRDGPLMSLDATSLHEVLRPKLDGALHLHELTRAADLSHFVLYASVAGVLGTLGQATYAGANTFLDALADVRRSQGLPGQSLAWGFWEQQGIGLSAHLGEADFARMRRQGLAAFPVSAGLALLDRALGLPDAALVPARLDLRSLAHELPATSEPPAMLRDLWEAQGWRSGRAQSVPALPSRLAGLPLARRAEAALDAVREEVAAVLRVDDPQAIVAEQPLKDMGLDSLMGVELRNRLSAQLGRPLPASLAFNYPTPAALAGFVLEELGADTAAEPAPEPWDDAAVRAKLQRISLEALRHSGLLAALMAQPDAPDGGARTASDVDSDAILSAAGDDELLDLAESLLGGS